MANILRKPSYQNANGYNGFDMDNLLKFSSTVGELLPVYYDLLQPGDKVTLGTTIKTRTMELASAAMCSLTEHLEWFFVPMEQLYTPFGSWYFGVSDIHSAYYRNMNIDYLPYFTPGQVLTALYNNATSNLADSIFPENYGSRYRLMEFLDIPFEAYYRAREESSVVGWCPIFAQAYQKIYHDYFRDSDREEMSPGLWNSDMYAETLFFPNNAFNAFLTLRYRSWKKDFYTNIFPSPLFGSDSVNSIGDRSINDLFHQWLVGSNFYTSSATSFYANPNTNLTPVPSDNVEPTNVLTNPYTPGNGSLAANIPNIQQALSPSSIRTSFAVQKYLEVLRRAGKTYDAQQLAHFGVKLSQGISGTCYRLGESTAQLQIGDVIATSTSSAGDATSVLGQVGGKGYAYGQGSDIKFTAPSHGILMCIFSVEPDVDYYGQSFDKLQTLMSRADWFTPEFDNLGMQPLFNYQSLAYNPSDTGWLPSGIIGWQYRYSELKCKYNRVRGSLRRSLNYWTTAREYMSNGIYSFKVNPSFLNSIMLDQYRGLSVADIENQNFFAHDPLIHELYFNVKKASKMSTYGLESL